VVGLLARRKVEIVYEEILNYLARFVQCLQARAEYYFNTR
jgi:hypothetical protein